MWAVAGNPNRGYEQHFEEIVSDKQFYKQNYSLFFPTKKTLLTLEYEHCGYNLIALAPKNYWCDDGVKNEVKLKGVSTRGNINKHINGKTFNLCLNKGKIIGAKNYVLRTKNHQMTKQKIYKTGLSGVITKSVCLKNNSCLPFVEGISAKDYIIE
jgi:hypothetical protein